MKILQRQQGFTLLELMVVVLVISLLAGVAVPQYKRAVSKSRYKTMFALAKAIHVGQEHFQLSEGHYAQDLSRLAISAPEYSSGDISVVLHNDDLHSYFLVAHKKLNNTLVTYNDHSPSHPGNVYCEAKAEDELAIWLCEEALHGTKVEDGSFTRGYIAYVLQGVIESLEGTPVAPHAPVSYTDQSGTSAESLVLDEGDSCTASSAQGCQYLDAHGAECTASGNGGCAYSSFSDDSTCNAGAQGGCFKSTFTDSSCIATTGGSNAATTSCGGEAVSDSDSHYVRSTCTNDSKNGYACGRSMYEDHSECNSNKYGGCGKSTFDSYSICYGNSNTACDGSTFTNYSVCVASVLDACKNAKKYDSTSYCEGDYCPNGSPTQDGKTWCRESSWGKDKHSVVCPID